LYKKLINKNKKFYCYTIDAKYLYKQNELSFIIKVINQERT